MNFFVIGAANFADTSNAHAKDVPKDSSKFFWAKESEDGGFASVELTSSNMTFTFVDGKGHQLYQQMLFPRKWTSAVWLWNFSPVFEINSVI